MNLPPGHDDPAANAGNTHQPRRMKLVKIKTNYYVDEDTQTHYEFIFNYAVPLEAAEYFVLEDVRIHKQTIEEGRYYGKPHAILQVMYLD